MLDTVYGAKLKDGEKTFWDVYRLLMKDGQEIDRRFMGYGQGLNPESAIADCLRLELGTLQDDRAQLKAGTLPIAQLDD